MKEEPENTKDLQEHNHRFMLQAGAWRKWFAEEQYKI